MPKVKMDEEMKAFAADLLERIAAGESQTLEFKASFDKASIESLAAFANTQGGRVLVHDRQLEKM